MDHDRNVAALGGEELSRAPSPFNHIVASPVFSTIWGRGWLGYTVTGDVLDLWFVHGDLRGTERLGYQQIWTYNEKDKSRFWMIFEGADVGDTGYQPRRYDYLLFVLYPQEDMVIFPVPENLLRFMERT